MRPSNQISQSSVQSKFNFSNYLVPSQNNQNPNPSWKQSDKENEMRMINTCAKEHKSVSSTNSVYNRSQSAAKPSINQSLQQKFSGQNQVKKSHLDDQLGRLSHKVQSIKDQKQPARVAEAKLKQVSEKQNDPAHIELHQRSIDRLEMLKQLEQRKLQELWCKAYGKEVFEEVKKDKSYVLVKEVKQGKWNLKKVPCLALEVRFVETVGNCFQVFKGTSRERRFKGVSTQVVQM